MEYGTENKRCTKYLLSRLILEQHKTIMLSYIREIYRTHIISRSSGEWDIVLSSIDQTGSSTICLGGNFLSVCNSSWVSQQFIIRWDVVRKAATMYNCSTNPIEIAHILVEYRQDYRCINIANSMCNMLYYM